ncbi:hypothetical protein [Thioalkalivibrio sp. ARh3]|uniref:hypothetical protein n=1 Tax=Thioalkalivibrio sp. ARh3 TaxID=1158148 RepID=UPI0003744B73|nr:hypothetical protein [Thioalkalivibrio sp. ARh3]
MEFDSEEWRQERNRRLHEWVQNEDAVRFILDWADACELFDDIVDRDKAIPEEHAVRVLFNVFTELPVNPFFDRFKYQLIPLLVTGINAWLDANTLERGSESERVFAYVMRDYYMEFVSFVIYLTRGRDVMRALSMEIREFFTHHETLNQYLEGLEEQDQ